MVIICKEQFTQNEDFSEHFDKYPFPLSDFQKYALKSITEGNHILITAHTGSGKTLPAEFAIDYFVSKGKKVIYTSPIKALSNQKFHEFSLKFPNISFGILTGDIKYNPEADVLIMTTEILRNTLLQKNINNNEISLQFEMDFQNELGAVVFDEIHYINDADRGKVWEETIMFLPNHVQLIMLSATIDKPEQFAKWVEDVKSDDEHNKIVYLAPTNHRVVPLKHYVYTTMPQGPFKNIKDKSFIKYINEFLHKPIEIKDSTKIFHDDNYTKVKKLLEYTKKNDCFIKPTFVLNEITKYLNKNNMLPAICFVFSRKLVEKYAQSINVSLFEDGSTVPSTIKHECEQILRKIPNHKEYTNLPEFEFIIRLLEKGVAIHHSGIMPIFREMIELLFAKGYIKLLFATETFAVGINMPTKTVLFTGFEKFNGNHMRLLLPHEYTQMAGRAGRRGLDTIGYVIHLNNMFNLPYSVDYKNLLNGKPQQLQSKFKISYNLVLNFHQYDNSTINFATKSMCYGEITDEINTLENNLNKTKSDLEQKCHSTPYESIIKQKDYFVNYISLQEELTYAKQKKRKQLQNNITKIENENKQFKNQLEQYKSLIALEKSIKEQENYLNFLKGYFQTKYDEIKLFLKNCDFIDQEDKISDMGVCATYIQETHCLAFVQYLFTNNFLMSLTSIEIAALLSCFTNIRVKDEIKISNPDNMKISDNLKDSIKSLKTIYECYDFEESRMNFKNDDELSYVFELIIPILNWCESKDENTCKKIIKTCEYEYEIFTGEFIKAILKINNIVNEMKSIAEFMGNIELLHKLQEIPELTLKFIATNQSLYV